MRQKALVVGAAALSALAAFAEAGANSERGFGYSSTLFNALVSEKNVLVTQGVSFGPGPRDKLDIYRPPKGVESQAIVIFYYGGGWRRGERAMYRFVGSALAAQGFTAVIPDYRLYPEVVFPAFMEDAALVCGFVDHKLNAGPRKSPVVLMGHSAGAYIAALLAVDKRYLEKAAPGAPPPVAVVGLAGPYSFDPTTWPRTREIFSAAAKNPDEARPVAFVSAEAPPMFLSRGGDDDVVAAFNADDFAKALREKGVPVENRLYPGLGHVGVVLAFSKPFRGRAPVLADSVAFIHRVLAKTETAARR